MPITLFHLAQLLHSYGMPILSIQHALQAKSGLPEDRFVNTFHALTVGEPLPADFTGIHAALDAFFRATGVNGLSQYMAATARGVGRTVKVYNLEDPKPRAPIYDATDTSFPWAADGTTGYPSEVCVCLSYSAGKLSGTSAGRRRGRIYVGPLNGTVVFEDPVTKAIRPSVAFRTALLSSFGTLITAMGAANAPLICYSPTIDSAGVGASGSAAVIMEYWVDDAFDTQRRRGVAPTTKQKVVLPG